MGLPEIARRCETMFEVGMTPREFCDRYREQIAGAGVSEGETREQVEQTRTALGLAEKDLVLGQYKVSVGGGVDSSSVGVLIRVAGVFVAGRVS